MPDVLDGDNPVEKTPTKPRLTSLHNNQNINY